jgi:hypothetical protein
MTGRLRKIAGCIPTYWHLTAMLPRLEALLLDYLGLAYPDRQTGVTGFLLAGRDMAHGRDGCKGKNSELGIVACYVGRL